MQGFNYYHPDNFSYYPGTMRIREYVVIDYSLGDIHLGAIPGVQTYHAKIGGIDVIAQRYLNPPEIFNINKNDSDCNHLLKYFGWIEAPTGHIFQIFETYCCSLSELKFYGASYPMLLHDDQQKLTGVTLQREDYVSTKPCTTIVEGVLRGLKELGLKGRAHGNLRPENIVIIISITGQITSKLMRMTNTEKSTYTQRVDYKDFSDMLKIILDDDNSAEGMNLFDRLSDPTWADAELIFERFCVDPMSITRHPFFWDEEKRGNYFIHLADFLKLCREAKEPLYEDAQNFLLQVNSLKDIWSTEHWSTDMQDLVDPEHDKSDFKEVATLVKFIRNKYCHYVYLKEKAREELGLQYPTSFDDYFRARFPSLIILTLACLQSACPDELKKLTDWAVFEKYFM